MEHDYQVLLHKDRHVRVILYLKIIIGLITIMSTDDILENSDSRDQYL